MLTRTDGRDFSLEVRGKRERHLYALARARAAEPSRPVATKPTGQEGHGTQGRTGQFESQGAMAAQQARTRASDINERGTLEAYKLEERTVGERTVQQAARERFFLSAGQEVTGELSAAGASAGWSGAWRLQDSRIHTVEPLTGRHRRMQIFSIHDRAVERQ